MNHKTTTSNKFRTRRPWIKISVFALVFILIFVGIYTHLHTYTESSQKAPSTSMAESTPEKKDGTTPVTTHQSQAMGSLSISKLGIKQNPIIKLGLTGDGAVDAPTNNTDVGWYQGSVEPGRGAGAVLIDGHAGAPNESAVFSRLHELVAGNTITIDKQGAVFAYEVRKVEITPANEVDMQKMLQSIEPTKEGLNLITCNGDYNSVTRQYTDRVLVYTVRIS